MRALKKIVQFELIFKRNNNNSDLTKELDKGESCLKKLRAKHSKNILFGHLKKLNTFKFEYLEDIIKVMFDVFLVSKFKLGLSFSHKQFQIANYNMFRKDQNKNGGGLLFYVNQDLNCKTVNTYNFPTDIEILPLELALTKRKWLILGFYEKRSLRSDSFSVKNTITYYYRVTLI